MVLSNYRAICVQAPAAPWMRPWPSSSRRKPPPAHGHGAAIGKLNKERAEAGPGVEGSEPRPLGRRARPVRRGQANSAPGRIDTPPTRNQNTRLVFAEGYPSGQREQTVNLPAYAFVGSNPTPSTTQAGVGSNHVVGPGGRVRASAGVVQW